MQNFPEPTADQPSSPSSRHRRWTCAPIRGTDKEPQKLPSVIQRTETRNSTGLCDQSPRTGHEGGSGARTQQARCWLEFFPRAGSRDGQGSAGTPSHAVSNMSPSHALPRERLEEVPHPHERLQRTESLGPESGGSGAGPVRGWRGDGFPRWTDA